MVDSSTHPRRSTVTVALAALLALAFVAGAMARAEPEDAAPAAPSGTAFDTPEAAAKAMVEAMAKNDDDAIKALLGTGCDDLVQSGSDPAVASDRAAFVKAAGEKLAFEQVDEDSVILVIGPNEWPVPLPVVRHEGKWYFDAAAGREEILARRIGRNELEAIDICAAYLDAQVVYASEDRDGDEVREYAQRIASTPGRRDGLYWATDEGAEAGLSPLGPLITPFLEFAEKKDGPVPFYGYYWKILTAQGPSAPGGAHSYVVNGNMISGFAAVGVPARYMNTGVMTFLVSHHGKILQKDLGEQSLEIVKAMEAYDPDDTWQEVTLTEEAEPEDE